MNQIQQAPTVTLNAETIARWIAEDADLASLATRRAYMRDVSDFNSWMLENGRTFVLSTVSAYAAALLSRGLSPNTVNRKLSVIRWTAKRLRQALREKGYDGVAMMALDDIIARKNVKVDKGRVKGRHVEDGEVLRLLLACENDPTAHGRRDAAIIALAYATGARRAELAGIQLEDITEISDGFAITITGKRQKVRKVYAYGAVAALLRAWLEVRGEGEGHLFTRLHQWQHTVINPEKPLNPAAFQKVLNRRTKAAGVEGCTIHDFRRTFAGGMLDEGADIATVAALMGHESVSTTARYDRRPEQRRMDAVKRRKLPFATAA